MASNIILLNSSKYLLNNTIKSKNLIKLANIACLNRLNSSLSTSSKCSIKQTTNNKSNKLQKSSLNLNQTCSIYTSRIVFSDVVTVASPGYAESIKEGDIQFLKKPGDAVKQDEVIAKIETDKTTIDISSPKDGVIDQLLVADGSAVKAFTNVITIKVGAGGGSAAPAATPTTPAAAAEAAPKQQAAKQAPPPPPPPKQASADIPSSLPRVDQIPTKPKSTTPIASIPVTPLKPVSVGHQDINKIGGTRSETRVKMSKMRQTVANRLKTSQNTCAMLTTFNEVNMGNLVDMRKSFGDAFLKKHNIKLGFMSAFVKAAAVALQDQSIVNAVIDHNEIVYRDYVDISVAVATPKGLVVPVLRNVEKMNYAGIEKEINELGEKARANKLAIEDMQGGTFTISNGGVFGSLFGTPIINLPQSAILGMHGIFDRPVAINGQVVIKPMMYIALTYDHRLIDGREAVTFLRKIKSTIEDPRTILLDI